MGLEKKAVGFVCRWMVAAPGISEARDDAGEHVDESEHQQDVARKKHQQIDADAEQNDPAEGLAAGEVDFFAAPEAPGADHEKADEADEQCPDEGEPPGEDGQADEAVYHRGDDAGGGRDGHANEVLAPGAAGVLGDGIDADVEAGETAGSAEQEEEADEGPELQRA